MSAFIWTVFLIPLNFLPSNQNFMETQGKHFLCIVWNETKGTWDRQNFELFQ